MQFSISSYISWLTLKYDIVDCDVEVIEYCGKRYLYDEFTMKIKHCFVQFNVNFGLHVPFYQFPNTDFNMSAILMYAFR